MNKSPIGRRLPPLGLYEIIGDREKARLSADVHVELSEVICKTKIKRKRLTACMKILHRE